MGRGKSHEDPKVLFFAISGSFNFDEPPKWHDEQVTVSFL
jgi:hypothetical protein